MTIAQQIYEKIKDAPDDVAREVLDFVEFLAQKKRLAPQQSDTATKKTIIDYAGDLSESSVFAGNAVDIQHKMRSEWEK